MEGRTLRQVRILNKVIQRQGQLTASSEVSPEFKTRKGGAGAGVDWLRRYSTGPAGLKTGVWIRSIGVKSGQVQGLSCNSSTWIQHRGTLGRKITCIVRSGVN